MRINASELPPFIYNGWNLLTLFGTVLILSKNKGLAVITHGGYINNLGFTFYPLLMEILKPNRT